MSSTFQKTIENFNCEHCNNKVEGTGYTNHCPECLWSKHVDLNPGDRAAICLGLMKPVNIGLSGQELVIFHECVECGYVKSNKRQKEGNFDEILRVISQLD